jgi:hypothetical protein
MAMAGFDDDDPPEFIKAKNFIFPSLTGDGTYKVFPMPLGYSIFPGLGRLITEYILAQNGVISSKKGASDVVVDIMSMTVEAFNPFGGVGPVLTLVKSSIAAWWENPEDEKKKAQDDYNKQLNEAIVKNLKIKSEKNKQVWDSSDEKKRELIKTKNGFKEIERILRNYTDPRLKVHNPNFVPLNYDQYNKIKEWTQR